MDHSKHVILASSSPRRLQLLQAIGFEVTVIPPVVDETQLISEPPQAMVARLAKTKANAIKTDLDLPIIAADTLVCLNDLVLGKPRDEKDAVRMLTLLSGREHTVITGYTVKSKKQEKTDFVKTIVSFRKLSENEILEYIKTQEPLDKAGAYGIQGMGAFLINEVKGSYTNVIGLPLNEVLEGIVTVQSL